MAVKSVWDSNNLIIAKGLIAGNRVRNNPAPARERKLMRLAGPLLAAPLLYLLAACSSAADPSSTSNTMAPVTANGTAVAPVTTTTTTTATSTLGVNTSTIQYWGGSRPFMNLIYGSTWSMNGGGGNADIPPEDLDANGWVKSLPAGYHAGRALSIPSTSADIVCTYVGNGLLNVVGPVVSNVAQSPGKTTFHYTSSYPNIQWASIYYDVDPANYIRNIDCREAGASTANLAPEFVNAAKGFQVIRFLGWDEAVNTNAPSITWANRNKLGDGDYVANDGVPVELMVDLANQTGADPWFTIPYNADDDYITKFATYVRDHLAAGRKAYVENSNEVWNFGFPQATQAMNEGIAEGLPGDIGGNFQRTAERSGEKTKHVMDIWSGVFAGQMNRLVRIFAWQNASPGYGEIGLKYALPSVDAYSTAPYFAFMPSDFTGQSLDDIMNTVLPGKISETVGLAAQNKAIAAKYNLRFIAYEGGQHVVLPSNLTLLDQIERDSRMYTLYKNYINLWNSQAGGDSLVLTNLQGGINSAGAWGMQEWIGQPIGISTTPKMQAVREFLGVATTSASSSTAYQTCPDGTVILATSTCPAPTTSGSQGQRKGSAKRAALG
jgi:hypothetical protein